MAKNRLGKIIKERGLNNTLLAILLDVHPSTVTQWIKNRQQPSMQNIVKLMRLLELRYDEIMIEDTPLVKKGTIQKLQAEYNRVKKELAPKIRELRMEKGDSKLIHPELIEAMKKLEKELLGEE